MRKLTGYIGAMIIVIALMGSILAGYALNVNGTTAVMNEYEKVTDVSGLYTHSQEPSYIDYNPASNYIGYGEETITYQSDIGTSTYKELFDENVTIKNTGEILIGGVSEGVPSNGTTYFITNQFYIEKTGAGILGITSVVGSNYSITTDITISISGANTTVSTTGFNVTFVNIYHNISYWVIDDTYDYYKIDGYLAGNTNDVNAYFKDRDQILTVSYVSPGITEVGGQVLITCGNSYGLASNDIIFGTIPYHWITDNAVDMGGCYKIQVNYPPFDYYWSDVSNPGNKTLSGAWIFYPKSVTTGGSLGINYTESNRVNNYPIETDYDTINNTTTASVDLSAISAANYYTGYNYYDYGNVIINTDPPQYYVTSDMVTNYKLYKFTDILSTLTVPANTTMISITNPSYPIYDSVVTGPWGNGFYYTVFAGANYYYNWVNFVTTPTIDNVQFVRSLSATINQTANYYPDTGIVEIYNNNGVKTDTIPISDFYIGFLPKTTNSGTLTLSGSGGTYTYSFDITAGGVKRQDPFINVVYSTTGTITNVHYADITKGYSIKSTNVTNTIWNNEYNNGNIQLLFRAENTPAIYHNDLIVGDNTISVDYNTNRYSVTLNGGDPVDIGTWRNIILDIDMINGELSVIPVRTFNSYTNVELDNTNIFVGDLVNPAPTNTIQWMPTSNSLTFNVYSTSVFMDTYGVVMVNPTLNITDYFTNLDNFYQLKLSNISVVGQSMTVNGVTGTVTGNTVTFNDETVQVKDMTITYADGHAYISDSHATIDLGTITDNTISMSGAWYFITDLMRGYTTQKMIYEWDWQDFILDNVQFCVIYIGLALIGLLIARHYCTLTITDYAIFMVSIIIALTVQVIA